MLNQIAAIFVHQYLWKEWINFLDFLIRDSNQGEEISETNTFNWAHSFICWNLSEVSLGHLMGAVRLKIDQKIKHLFISKSMEVIFVVLCTKRDMGVQQCIFFCSFVISYIKYLSLCIAPYSKDLKHPLELPPTFSLLFLFVWTVNLLRNPFNIMKMLQTGKIFKVVSSKSWKCEK